MTPQSVPIHVEVPGDGVRFAESVHAADFAMAERRDGFSKLLYVPVGRVAVTWEVAYRRTTQEGGRGSLWIIPAGVRHRLRDIEPSTVLLCCLGRQFAVEPAVGALLSRPSGPLTLTREGENHWRRAILEGTGKPLGWETTQRALAQQLLVATARRRKEPATSRTEDRLARLRGQVDETLYEAWSLDRAAEAAGLSRRQFTKLFRAQTGRTFLEYLTEARLAYVESLLRSGRSTVTGAVFSAGFEDLSHFYRLWRRRTGVAPGEWVRRMDFGFVKARSSQRGA